MASAQEMLRLCQSSLYCSFGAALRDRRRPRPHTRVTARKADAPVQARPATVEGPFEKIKAPVGRPPKQGRASPPSPAAAAAAAAAAATAAAGLAEQQRVASESLSEVEALLSSSSEDDDDEALPPATELIFRLERRGEGWGEEIIPHLTVEQRPLTLSAKGRRAAAEDAEEDDWAVSAPLLPPPQRCRTLAARRAPPLDPPFRPPPPPSRRARSRAGWRVFWWRSASPPARWTAW